LSPTSCRSRATIDKSGEFSALFISSNRGKRSLSVDVKSTFGREVLAKLVAQADVLVQNFRPGTMERLGLGVDELRQRHPRLIYVSISGVGETGPYMKKRVYDPIIQALSGFADIQSQPVTNRPQMIRTIVCDKTTAVFTAQAVAAALYAREKTGQGDHIQVAMLDAMISYLWPEGMMQYTVVGAETTAADPNDRPDLVFKTSDGYITAGTISDSEWQGFCRASGDPELATDPRFATPSARSVNATARINKMAEYIGQHSTAEWLERLDAADVPCAPILRRSEIIHNEQVIARGIIAEFDQPKVGRVRQPKPAARFEINEAAIGGPAPRVGEHSRDVFPFLQDRKIPAVFFPAASSLIDRHVLDVNKIQFVLAAAPSEEALVEIIDMAVERAAERKDVRALSDYRSDGWKPVRYDSPATSYIKCMLQGVLPADIRATLLDGLFTRFVSSDEKAFAEELYFTTEEAREMARGGATIGCHADRHVTLTSMPREGQAREIDGSLRVLEQIGLPRTPLFFSYAKGAYDSDSVDLLRARGCSLAVTNTPDIATLSPETMLSLPRLDANHLPSDASAPPHAWTLKA
jgi:crotonobetainyl-CoA:carnitine CoA-transferase CaiB-like acyl-CoA transferase